MFEHRRTTDHPRRRIAALAAAVVSAMAATLLPVPAQAATAPRPIVTGWIYGSPSSVATVTANADLFSEVSPFWFSMRGNAGAMWVSSSASNTSIASAVASLHAAHVRVVPTATDGTGWRQMSAQLSTAAGRSAVVGLLVSVVTSHGFDGIDLDWEQFAFNDGSSTWAATRAGWIPFVQSLAAALHARGRTLSVTVPAGTATSSDSTGYWVYAWSQIGSAVDRMRIMAYDYSPSRPGPIGPYPWAQAVVAHAVTQVPAGKIQIGVAAYGRDWWTSTSGTCPTLAPAGVTAAQSTSFFSDLSWAGGRHAFPARGATSYIGSLFTDGTPGITVPQRPVITWNATQKESTYGYRVTFTGRRQPATVRPTAVGGLVGQTTVMLASTAGILPGMTVPPGSTVGAKVVSVAGSTVTLSIPNATQVKGSLPFGFPDVATTATAAADATVLAVPLTASAGIHVGAVVTGTGIQTGTTVVQVAPSATDPAAAAVTLSAPVTAALAATPVTFRSVVTTTAVGGLPGGTTVLVSSPSGVTAGAAVSGSGITAGTLVQGVSGNLVTLTKPNTGAVTGALTVTPAPVVAACTVSRVGWYSDAQSAIARASLVGAYHLAGIAQWTIGGEDTAQWSGLRTYARSIAQVPTAVTITAPASLYAGHRATLRATAYAGGKPAVGAQAVFQWQPAGSAAWTTVGSALVSSTGAVALLAPPVLVSGRWRVVVPGNWARSTGSAVAATTRVVKAPASLSVTVPARLLTGTAGIARTRLVSLGAPVRGAVVSFWWMRPGTTTWVLFARVATDANGAAAAAYRPASSVFVRATFAGTSTLAPVSSRLVGTGLVPTIKPTTSLVRVARNQVAVIRAVVAPAVAFGPVIVQRHTATGWQTVATVRTSATGVAALRVPTGSRGTWYYRFLVAGTPLHTAAGSPWVTVSVV